MKAKQLRSRWWKRAARAGVLSAVAGAAAGINAGCLDRPVEPVEPRTTSTVVERLTQSSVDKIDILLAIDNSRSMADKQGILALAIPDLVRGLVNPLCVDEKDNPAGTQPAGPLEPCPAGTEREFDPVLDIHIGLITSSLGGHGSDSCQTTAPAGNPTNDDMGHLIARKSATAPGDVPTWQDKKFLAWDPSGMKKVPAGETNLDSLITNLKDMVVGAGQQGCGYEAQLESIFRFLVDPAPYASIKVIDGKATKEGVDEVLRQQRADFLRPNSLLAMIMLTDENDCSIREYGQYFFAGQLKNADGTNFHLPRSRSECASNPNDACCKSCGQPAGECPADPACDSPTLPAIEDEINLRCFEQKRRFGIDFLYPVQRYVNAFTQVQINPVNDDLSGSPAVANPIYSDLNPSDDISSVRDSGLVFFAGLVGVPWQDIAKNPGDLKEGFKTAEELGAANMNGQTAWDIILGNPAEYVKPLDPHMVESIDARSGTNPITGDSLPTGSNLNGGDWQITRRDDLQYACIFELPATDQRDCSDPNAIACDCSDPPNQVNNPLCEPDPGNSNLPTLQVRAKAYPGVRELQVLKAVGTQGITASVCPAQVNNPASPDFGYRPAIQTIIERLKTALGGQCLPRTLTPDAEGLTPCLIIEASKTDSCSCQAPRQDVSEEHKGAIAAAKADPLYASAQWNCFCEIAQLTGEELNACLNDLADPPLLGGQQVNGWCYIDATTTPPTGNVELVAKCPDTERRLIRFVGSAEALAGTTQFITCSGE